MYELSPKKRRCKHNKLSVVASEYLPHMRWNVSETMTEQTRQIWYSVPFRHL